MKRTRIEWVRNQDGSQGDTWNVMVGCRKVSPGCTNCYAERLVNGRLRGDFQQITLKPDRLAGPLHTRKPTTYFVNSLSDLWLATMEGQRAFLDQVLAVMMLCQRHTFIVATKRPQLALDYLTEPGLRERVAIEMAAFLCGGQRPVGVPELLRPQLPLPNLWHLASCENQQWYDRRVAVLMQIPAVRRGVSLEPLLGPIDLRLTRDTPLWAGDGPGATCRTTELLGLHWVIGGGESGPPTKAIRPTNPRWVRSLGEQCELAGLPFLWKQWGEWSPDGGEVRNCTSDVFTFPDGQVMRRVGKKAAGRLLDGKLWDGMPAWPAEGKA